MEISLVKESELTALSKMVQKTCRESFKFFYPNDWIEYTIKRQTPQRFREMARAMHLYVAKKSEKIIGCAGIGRFKNLEDECVIVSFFVASDWQGKGIGKELLKTIEKDDIYLRVRRVEVASSLNAVPFYLKNGFKYKNGEMVLDYGSLHLEKFLR